MLDYPKAGTGAVVDALVRGFTKRGGKLHLGAHVHEILLDDAGPEKPRATGVRLRNGRVLKARKAVISNASIWNTRRLLPQGSVPEWGAEAVDSVAQCESFLHLHAGIDAAGLPEGLNCHYALVDDWSRGITAPGNVIIVSIPSLLDPSLAPAGCHTIHAYTGAFSCVSDVIHKKKTNTQGHSRQHNPLPKNFTPQTPHPTPPHQQRATSPSPSMTGWNATPRNTPHSRPSAAKSSGGPSKRSSPTFAAA